MYLVRCFNREAARDHMINNSREIPSVSSALNLDLRSVLLYREDPAASRSQTDADSRESRFKVVEDEYSVEASRQAASLQRSE